MKRRLLDAGSYLLAGIASCAVLVAVSMLMTDESPLPAAAQSPALAASGAQSCVNSQGGR